MIEKAFDKTYAMKGCHDIPQSTFTRIANRLLKEYIAVNGDYCIPDEIKAIVDAIKQGKDSEQYDDENDYEISNTTYDDREYDTCKISYENRAHVFWDEDEYGDSVYHATWYFFTSATYTKRVGKQVLRAGTHTEILRKVYAAKGKYRYYCTHRPPSGGCIPEGYVSYETYRQGSRHIGEVTYNEKPSEHDLQNWGLVFDPEYERLRAAYTEVE